MDEKDQSQASVGAAWLCVECGAEGTHPSWPVLQAGPGQGESASWLVRGCVQCKGDFYNLNGKKVNDDKVFH